MSQRWARGRDISTLGAGCESADFLSRRHLSYGEVEIRYVHSRRLLALEYYSRLLGLASRITVEHSLGGFQIPQHHRIRSPHSIRGLDSPQINSDSEREGSKRLVLVSVRNDDKTVEDCKGIYQSGRKNLVADA